MRIGVATSRGVLEYRTRDERPLTEALPVRPAAVRVYGADGCSAALCLDLDASRAGEAAVRADAERLARWLTAHGARFVSDVSPNGGIHLYVPVADRIPYDTAREIVEALAAAHPTLDPSPHRSIKTGCIRVPGSAHKSGGHQQLTTPLNVAYDVLRRPNAAAVLAALRSDLAPQIAAWRDRQTDPAPWAEATATADVDAGPVGRLSPRVRAVAETGQYDPARYASASEARQSVITAAVRQGWALRDVAVRLADGRWPGLASLYARYSPTQRHGALARDWHTAQRFIAAAGDVDEPTTAAGTSHVRKSHTSRPKSHGGATIPPGTQLEHDHIRTWRTLLRGTEQARFPGRAGYLSRFVLRALGEAAHKTGDRRVAFGTRSLAVAVGADHSTVAAVLRRLADQPGGWIDLVDPARGEHADLYELTIPADLADVDLRWDNGLAHALRPAFRELGHVTAFVFEAIEARRANTITTLVGAVGMARATVSAAVDTLLAYGLAERRDGRLHARPDQLLVVAELLGALEHVAAQVRRHAEQRARWHAWLARHQDHAPTGDPEDAWWPPGADDISLTRSPKAA